MEDCFLSPAKKHTASDIEGRRHSTTSAMSKEQKRCSWKVWHERILKDFSHQSNDQFSVIQELQHVNSNHITRPSVLPGY